MTFTTALEAKPPPFTVKVNAGPPVATMEGEMEVISTPMPNRNPFCGELGPSSETLIVAFSLPAKDGVNVTPTLQNLLTARANGAAGQGV